MKNFFKKLAFVLSLAMVLTTLTPAAQASAASAPAFKNASKILYIGGDVSKEYGETYTFQFKNTKGYTATWKANNPSVATMSDEKNTVVAVAPGTATFTATLTNKAGKTAELTAKVWVRQNADSVGFGSKKAIETAKVVGDTFKINVYRGLDGKKVWTQSDVATITDKIVWSSSDEKVATVNKWGTVTCVGAGEATITAKAVQNQGKLESASASYTFTVNAGITAAKVISTTTAELTVGGAITEDVAKTLTMENSKGVNLTSYIKSVSLDKTGTKLTVESYVAFADKETYTFAIDSLKTAYDMVVSIGTPTQIVLTAPATVVENDPSATELKWDVLDANGIKLSSNTGNVTFTVDNSTYCYLDTSAKTLRMYKAGETVKVTATYHTGEYDTTTWTEKTFPAELVVTCIAKGSDFGTGSLKYTVATSAPDWDKDAQNARLALDKANYKLYVKVLNGAGKELAAADYADVKFESLNPSVLFVGGVDAANKCATLVPVSEGSTTVRVLYKNNFVGLANIVVGAKSTATDITVKASGNTQLSNETKESVTFTFETKDQYGAQVAANATNYTVDLLAAPAGVTVDTFINKTVEGGKLKVTFTAGTAAAVATAGSYSYKVTLNNKVAYATATVVKPGSSVVSYQVRPSANEVDTKLTKDTTLTGSQITFQIVGVDAAGVAKEVVAPSAVTDLAIKTGDGKTLAFTASGSTYTINTLTTATDGAITLADGTKYNKVANGTYAITAKVNDGTVARPIAGMNIIIKDTQAVPVVATKTAKIELSTSSFADKNAVIAAIRTAYSDLFTAKVNDLTQNLVIADIDTALTLGGASNIAGTYYVNVKKLTATEVFGSNSITHSIYTTKVIEVVIK